MTNSRIYPKKLMARLLKKSTISVVPHPKKGKLNIPKDCAPKGPVDGDMWEKDGQKYARVRGKTVNLTKMLVAQAKKLMAHAKLMMTPKPQPVWCNGCFWPDGFKAGFKPDWKADYLDENGKKFSVCYTTEQVREQVNTFAFFTPFIPLGNTQGNKTWFSRPTWGEGVTIIPMTKPPKAQVSAIVKRFKRRVKAAGLG